MCQSSGDIISDLPRDAVDNILKCLSLRDAVRTSILSRRWRYLWASMPNVVFDRDTFKLESMRRNHNKLLMAIYEVLLLYRGLIVKFVLSLPGLKSCPEIDKVISFLSSKNCGLKEFTLRILEGDEQYKLPSSLFYLVELTHLNLEHCVIEPAISFKGFNRLVSMEISKCSILSDVLSGLISSCPLLEEVKVSSTIRTEGHIEISAPKLRKLSLIGVFPSICVKYAPCLSSCFMYLGGLSVPLEETSNFFKSVHNLPAIEDLDLSYYYAGDPSVHSNSIPRKLTTSLNHLVSLTLWEIRFDLLHEISTVLCLIRSSPKLVKLVLQSIGDLYASEDDSDDDDDLGHIMSLFQVEERCNVYLNSLREVEFNEVAGGVAELKLIELLLSISPKLETMIMVPYKKNGIK